jgi:hypothetical protein
MRLVPSPNGSSSAFLAVIIHLLVFLAYHMLIFAK